MGRGPAALVERATGVGPATFGLGSPEDDIRLSNTQNSQSHNDARTQATDNDNARLSQHLQQPAQTLPQAAQQAAATPLTLRVTQDVDRSCSHCEQANNPSDILTSFADLPQPVKDGVLRWGDLPEHIRLAVEALLKTAMPKGGG